MTQTADILKQQKELIVIRVARALPVLYYLFLSCPV